MWFENENTGARRWTAPLLCEEIDAAGVTWQLDKPLATGGRRLRPGWRRNDDDDLDVWFTNDDSGERTWHAPYADGEAAPARPAAGLVLRSPSQGSLAAAQGRRIEWSPEVNAAEAARSAAAAAAAEGRLSREQQQLMRTSSGAYFQLWLASRADD